MITRKRQNKSIFTKIPTIAKKPKIELQDQDDAYNKVLRIAILQSKIDIILKIIFFAVVVGVFIYVCYRCLIIFSAVIDKPDSNLSDVAAVISAVAAITTSIIILPKIVANHLFPPNGEELRYKFIKSLKELDLTGLSHDDIPDDANMETNVDGIENEP